MGIEIRVATSEEIPAIVDFVTRARADMFPMLDATWHQKAAQQEQATFQQAHLDHSHGTFLVALADGCLIATIGYVAYDDRFPQFTFKDESVVEVVRLYVEPTWRRAGLASKLYSMLEVEARKAGIERLYLHTHPFLPGAVGFWERQGFSILYIDHDDEVWRTTHMSQPIGGGAELVDEVEHVP